MVLQRRLAREKAMQTLFQIDVGRHRPEKAITFITENRELTEGGREFARRLVLGAIENLKTIDSLIDKYSGEWDLQRLANVDRNILRLATYEMLFEKDIPFSVSINEAVELAKTFGSDESGSFVNGILDSVGQEIETEGLSEKGDESETGPGY